MIVGEVSLDGTEISRLSNSSEKKVNAKCDECGCDQILIWANYRRSQTKRGHDRKTFCRPCKSRENMTKAREGGPWNKGHRIPADQRKGKPYITKDGYRAVFQYAYDRDYHSQWANYRKEHLVLMEAHLGRPLKDGEVIHHVDGDKLNNELFNLWLTDSAGHRRSHNSLQTIGYALFGCGLITFDREKGEYKLAKREDEEWLLKLKKLGL